MRKLIIIGLVYLAITGLTWLITKSPNATQTMAVLLTGLIVLWYTYETKLLRSETQRQTEMSQRPFVVAKLVDDHFEVSNLGHGVALNIRIKPIEVDQAEQILIQFPDSIPTLNPGETMRIIAESFKKKAPAGDFFLAHLDPNYANRELVVEVKFQSIDFREYLTKEKILPGKREITEFIQE